MRNRIHGIWPPHKGELIYSFLVRQYFRDWRPNFGNFLTYITNSTTGYSSLRILLPKIAPLLTANVPTEHPFSTPRKIIDEFSPLPLLMLFESDDTRREIENRWMHGNAYAVHAYLGLTRRSGLLNPSHLKYCPSCIADDLEKLVPPMPYWRIAHQLPIVFVCPQHHTPLANGCSVCGGPHWTRLATYLPGMCACGLTTIHRIANPDFKITEEKLSVLARWTSDALDQTKPIPELQEHSTFWQAVSSTLALNPTGPKTQPEALTVLREAYDDSCLSKFSIAPKKEGAPRKEVGFELSDSRSLRSFARLLILAALFPSLKNFQDSLILATAITREKHSKEQRILGLGRDRSWVLTLPDLIKKYNGSMIKVSEEIGLSVGTVSTAASSLGLNGTIRVPKGRVEFKMLRMLKAGEEKNYIADALKISRCRVSKFSLEIPGLQNEWKQAAWLRYRTFHRDVYLKTSPSLKAASSDAYRSLVASTDWLRKYDGEWLQQQRHQSKKMRHHSPITRKQSKKSCSNQKSSLDKWLSRDDQLLNWMREQVAIWKQTPPPFRISKSKLIEAHPLVHAFNRWPERFTCSQQFIRENQESKDAHVKRILRAVVGQQDHVNVPTLTQKYVIKHTNFCPQTIRSYWPYVCELIKETKVSSRQ